MLMSPLLYCLLDITLKAEDNDSSNIRHLKAAIAEDLGDRYSASDVHCSLSFAAFFDPHFKDLNLFIPEEDRDDIKEDEILQLFQNVEAESQNQNDDEPVEPPSPKRKKCGPVSSLFACMAQSSNTRYHDCRQLSLSYDVTKKKTLLTNGGELTDDGLAGIQQAP